MFDKNYQEPGSVEELPARWRDWADSADELRYDQSAAAFRKVAEDLERFLESHGNASLTLSQAASESGYSPGHLGRLVRSGKIPNDGQPGSPRIARRNLPIKDNQPLRPLSSETGPRRGSKLQIVQSIIDGVS